ncbi:TetR/AcrR family transcriptional regulator [bacterium]|nr:TetR/AcrR family transcriptional regulator [bacterium]
MGIKERKEREKKQRANDILEAARQLFERKGFLNTPLQDVAKEAEISVGLIYRYFQSKEDIFASLALKGAEQYDKQLEVLLKKAKNAKNRTQVLDILVEIAESFFSFYGPYGEYFDMLLYSYKGMKDVQIQATTLTRLMSVTLSSLDKLKIFVHHSPYLKARNEDEALRTVFLLWGLLLGCHKLFDSSGRGHLFAFPKNAFIREMIEQVLSGIGEGPSDSKDFYRKLHSFQKDLSLQETL